MPLRDGPSLDDDTDLTVRKTSVTSAKVMRWPLGESPGELFQAGSPNLEKLEDATDLPTLPASVVPSIN